MDLLVINANGKSMVVAVTGAFSYTGKYIAKILIEKGERVITFTNHKKHLQKFEKEIETFPYNFSDKGIMANVLKGIDVFYNTYWIRFAYKNYNFEEAIKNSKILINICKDAGIKKIVQISITNASLNSPFPYFKGKAIIEEYIKNSGLNYTILRPTLIFGSENILINNISFLLRKFPFFFVFGNGDYFIQPIYVEDLANIAIEYSKFDNSIILDVAGPKIYSYFEFVNLIKERIESKSKIIKACPLLCFIFANIIGFFQKDIVITKDEIKSLMSNLLYSIEKPLGLKSFDDWLYENKQIIGKSYKSELKKHYKK